MRNHHISRERLHQLFEYRDGNLYWRIDRGVNAKAGELAGKMNKGRRYVGLDYRLHPVYRLIWIYFNGSIDGHVDHINGDKNDNRIENLRVVTHAQNMQNMRKATKRNKLGLLGVKLHKQSGLYQATIMVNGKSHSLKYHKTPEAAHAAYLEAKRRLHPFGTI